MKRSNRGTPLAERFERLVSPEPNSGCHLWLGASVARGYGFMRIDNRTRMATHVALELAGIPRPDAEVFACHKCDVPCCVNPDHLFWGTQFENMADQKSKGRHALSQRNHCKNGHEFTAENTRHDGRRRVCRACERAASKRKNEGGPGKGWAKGSRRIAVGERRRISA